MSEDDVERVIVDGAFHGVRARTLAAMTFPLDIELREACELHLLVKAEMDGSDHAKRIELEVGTVWRLLDAPSTSAMRSLEAKAIKEGVVAGDILGSIYLMDRFALDTEPSINKAIHVMQRFAVNRKYGDGSPLWQSERWLKLAWKAMKPVAHLWAAFRINSTYPFCEERGLFTTDDNFRTFLRVAASLGTFGTGFIPKRARPKEPILDASEMWKLPLSPERDAPLSLNTERRPDLLEEFLADYEAPPSFY